MTVGSFAAAGANYHRTPRMNVPGDWLTHVSMEEDGGEEGGEEEELETDEAVCGFLFGCFPPYLVPAR